MDNVGFSIIIISHLCWPWFQHLFCFTQSTTLINSPSLSLPLPLSIYLSMSIYICLHICLSVCLSIYLYIYHLSNNSLDRLFKSSRPGFVVQLEGRQCKVVSHYSGTQYSSPGEIDQEQSRRFPTHLVRRHRQKYHQNISLFEEIMKLGIWVAYPTRIILRSGPNSETPSGSRHLEFQNGRHSEHINLPNSKTMIDRNLLFVASPPFLGVRNLIKPI